MWKILADLSQLGKSVNYCRLKKKTEDNMR